MSEISQISCQLSFYPLGAADYNQIVEQVLQLIQQQTAVTAETNELATILRGPVTDIFKLLEQITNYAQEQNWHFVCNATISNTCGCQLENN
ncbi:YkoF family thiamine/hydroxymethylpyrimidine-binding protein [uncultured Lactobacillus sp.]|uniref:YkoF family thiamine/hydroxymethylpyrimidine-binding protein n=1 Tax=uncultured Lactobacillus sp. TaxID=153152 RepID=UPI0025DA2C8E|nr:YkoF family thiamine/hydroxymethylpyrimidine-binding protein [uncultured Lactobacillus sp.]